MSEWGPWIEHDGGLPKGVRVGEHVLIAYADDLLRSVVDGRIDANAPGWFWRWQRVRVGWFKTERRRVCVDPVYSPVLAYRVRKPSALTLLERIAADPQPIPGEPVPA